jgi:hypothetical protein
MTSDLRGEIPAVNWTTQTEPIDGGHAFRGVLRAGDVTATWADVIDDWQSGGEIADAFRPALADAPFRAFCFETPPVSRDTADRQFEFVLIDAQSLAGVDPEPWIFEEHFTGGEALNGVVTFPNIGRDATLVAPCPTEPLLDYAHLAVFTRHAPREQQLALWRAVGEAAEERFRASGPVWISTSGLQVFWLHVRLDSYPKYYNHAAYRHWGPG